MRKKGLKAHPLIHLSTPTSPKQNNQLEQSPKKLAVKPTQFKYKPEPIIKRKNRSTSAQKQKQKKQFIPIKVLMYENIQTLVEKISLAPQLAQLGEAEKVKMIMSQIQFHRGRQSQVDMSYKKFITPRDTQYVPKPFVFERYNYQNYQNYKYKNPYKPTKFALEDRVIKQPNKNIKKGTQKNLQIVFCEQKYKDFVQKTNQRVNQFYQVKRRNSVLNLPSQSRPSKIMRANSQNKLDQRRISQGMLTQKFRKKSTLSNYLQQFNTLQKLSQYMQRQHRLNQKYLFSSVSSKQNSNTVLLDIVIHRFDFLRTMKKKTRQLIFKTVLGVQEIHPYFKINIQDYLKFVKIFVSRDADQFDLAMFIFSFLFKEEQEISENAAKKAIDMLRGSANLHSEVQQIIFQMIKQNNQDGRKIFQAIKQNERLQRLFIDLILSK